MALVLLIAVAAGSWYLVESSVRNRPLIPAEAEWLLEPGIQHV